MNILEAKGICKSFPGVVALDNVDFALERGEVHALCGANGAGKSTIIKIIAGILPADKGELFLEGRSVHFRNTNMAFEAGVGTIFQDFELAQNLTVAENISLGKLSKKRKLINWKDVEQRAKDVLQSLQIDLDVNTLAGKLSVGEQQMVEIARVMSHDVKILIMDEPTSSLCNEDVETLFSLVKRLTERGVSVLYVSHRMEEVFRISDRITVFRDGKRIATYATKDVTSHDVISTMIGGKSYQIEYKCSNIQEENLLTVKQMHGPLLAHPVSFHVRRQEILGIAGLMGSGRTEILLSLFGLGGQVEGEILLDGAPYCPRNPEEAMKQGVAMVPEDRHNAGIMPNLSVAHNIVITCLNQLKKCGLIHKPSQVDLVKKSIVTFGIKTASDKTIVNTLSGGNQQKVVFAKWLTTTKKLLLLDEPTRGIDVGAKAEIYALTNQLVDQGLSVIIVSSELKELLDVCDRILVLHKGEIAEEIVRENFDYNEITQSMMCV